MTSLRNIEPKLVVKLQPFGTERVIFPLINTSDTLSKLLNFMQFVALEFIQIKRTAKKF